MMGSQYTSGYHALVVDVTVAVVVVPPMQHLFLRIIIKHQERMHLYRDPGVSLILTEWMRLE